MTTTVVGSAREPSTPGEIMWGWLFQVVAIILAGIGFWTMFTYGILDDGPGRIVGGDAYNYIIIATRGVGFIAAGIVASLIGVFIVLSGILASGKR